MIRPAQVALVERARTFFAERPAALARFPEPGLAAELSASAYEGLMNFCTVYGFRDRRRLVLSQHARVLLLDARTFCRIGDFLWTSWLRSRGAKDTVDLDGLGLISLLATMERERALDVSSFIQKRREVTSRQVQLLQVARKQLKMTDVRFSEALQDLGGVNSTTDLDKRGFDLMLAFMHGEGFAQRAASGPAPDDLGVRPGFASADQLGLIRDLWREWSGGDDEAALVTWLERFHRVSALRFLTASAAAKVITALKTMKRRRQVTADGTAA